MLSHLLLAAVCGLRPLGGAAERSAVVTEVTGGVHLVLREVRQRGNWSNKSFQLHTKSWQSYPHVCRFSFFLTSRISNLSVLTLPQVFLSLATGLMFIPAVSKSIQCLFTETDQWKWANTTASLNSRCTSFTSQPPAGTIFDDFIEFVVGCFDKEGVGTTILL